MYLILGEVWEYNSVHLVMEQHIIIKKSAVCYVYETPEDT